MPSPNERGVRPRPRAAALSAALVALLLAAAAAQGADHGALEAPDLREGDRWSYRAINGSGAARDDGTVAEAWVDEAPEGSDARWVLVSRTVRHQEVEGGAFNVTLTTRLHLVGDSLYVWRQESEMLREGVFRGVPMRAHALNVTTYDPPLPLLPAPGEPGDAWVDHANATARTNGTTHYGAVGDAQPITEGPREVAFRATQRLRVHAVENVTTPAGEFTTYRVERTRDGAPGSTVEWWAPDVGYMVAWVVRDGAGNATGGAELTAYTPGATAGEAPAPWWRAAAALALAAAVVGGAWWWRARRR